MDFLCGCYFISKKAYEVMTVYGYWNTWFSIAVAVSQPGYSAKRNLGCSYFLYQ